MRILHVSSSFPVQPGDSTAPFMEEMTAALARSGHAVRVIVPHIEGLETGRRSGVELTPYRYAPPRLQIWGYGRSLTAEGTLRRSMVITAPMAIAAMVAKTRTEIRRWKPDVLHLHWLLPQGVLSNFTPPDLPLVISLHGADVRMARSSKVITTLATRALRRADQLVAASGEMFDLIADLDDGVRTRSSVIPHGANAELFQPADRRAARQRLGLASEHPVVLGVGRLVAKKGFKHLLSAVGLVATPDTQVFLAGDGPQFEILSAMATKPRRSATLLGAIDRRTLADWYAAADVVVVPSVRDARDVDSGPVVLMEALASGRPVISTPVGMAPDVIVDGVNGYLIPEADPIALAQAIDRALERSEELGQAAAETFARVGDWNRVAGQLEQVYEAAITTRGIRL